MRSDRGALLWLTGGVVVGLAVVTVLGIVARLVF
jgi:hypothetical protein